MTNFSLLKTSQLWYLGTVDFWSNLDAVENRKTRLSGSQRSLEQSQTVYSVEPAP